LESSALASVKHNLPLLLLLVLLQVLQFDKSSGSESGSQCFRINFRGGFSAADVASLPRAF